MTSGKRTPAAPKTGKRADTENHRPNILCSRGFEQVSATSGTIPDIISDKVSDGSRVPDIILGYAGFDFTDKVCPDIGGLCIDTAAELGKEGHKRGTKREPNDYEGSDLRICTEGIVGERDPKKRHRRDGETRNCTPPE